MILPSCKNYQIKSNDTRVNTARNLKEHKTFNLRTSFIPKGYQQDKFVKLKINMRFIKITLIKQLHDVNSGSAYIVLTNLFLCVTLKVFYELS